MCPKCIRPDAILFLKGACEMLSGNHTVLASLITALFLASGCQSVHSHVLTWSSDPQDRVFNWDGKELGGEESAFQSLQRVPLSADSEVLVVIPGKAGFPVILPSDFPKVAKRWLLNGARINVYDQDGPVAIHFITWKGFDELRPGVFQPGEYCLDGEWIGSGDKARRRLESIGGKRVHIEVLTPWVLGPSGNTCRMPPQEIQDMIDVWWEAGARDFVWVDGP